MLLKKKNNEKCCFEQFNVTISISTHFPIIIARFILLFLLEECPDKKLLNPSFNKSVLVHIVELLNPKTGSIDPALG